MPRGAFPRHVRVVVAASICLGVAIGRRFSANVQSLRRETSRWIPRTNYIGSPLNANSWPSSRIIQRTKLSGPTWQRDGYGALNCLIAKAQLRNPMVPWSDIEKLLTIGLINLWRSRDQIERLRGRRASWV